MAIHITLLALNGLWVSEATGADIEQLGLERGHRALAITRKDGKVVTVPLARVPPGRSSWRSASAPEVPVRHRGRAGRI